MRPFHERFELDIPVEDAQLRFVNRALNTEFSKGRFISYDNHVARRSVATAIGALYRTDRRSVGYYVKTFQDCLRALEVAYSFAYDSEEADEIEELILSLLANSEADLGVRWEGDHFVKTGAALLDDELVNKQLRWLRDRNLLTVRAPFEKALRHLLEAESDPSRLADVITDAYEALEALSKLVTGREGRDLSGNAQLMIKNLKASKEMSDILREYISYANRFRHAETEAKPRPSVNPSEAEYFVYSTGSFIRLAIESGALSQEAV